MHFPPYYVNSLYIRVSYEVGKKLVFIFMDKPKRKVAPLPPELETFVNTYKSTTFSAWKASYVARHKAPSTIEDTITQLLAMKEKGKDFNKSIKSMREFSNPGSLTRLSNQKVDEFGSNFETSKWNPQSLPKTDYYKALSKEYACIHEITQ